jgi:starch synthase (maltosyl-transferring)
MRILMAESRPRICFAGIPPAGDFRKDWLEDAVAKAADLGFDHLLFGRTANGNGNGAWGHAVRDAAEACAARGLRLLLDLEISEFDPGHRLVFEHPEWFSLTSDAAAAGLDPRFPHSTNERALVRIAGPAEEFVAWWAAALCDLAKDGARGFRALRLDRCSPELWRELIAAAHARDTGAIFIADTPGLPRERLSGLKDCGFDFCLSSLPWWDGRAAWFAEEQAAAKSVAPSIALVEAEGRVQPTAMEVRRSRLALAAFSGSGVMMPLGFEDCCADGETGDLSGCVRAMNAIQANDPVLAEAGELRSFTGPGDLITLLIRAEGADTRIAERGLLAILNPDRTVAAEFSPALHTALGDWTLGEPLAGFARRSEKLLPGEARLIRVERTRPILRPSDAPDKEARRAAGESRIVIANIAPGVSGFAVKRIVGESLTVSADIFSDGHPALAAALRYKADDERDWQSQRMRELGNDRWSATFSLHRVGVHRFCIEAWVDIYGTFARDLTRKREAGVDVNLDIEEGRRLIASARDGAQRSVAPALDAILKVFEGLSAADRVTLLLAPETIEAMSRADPNAWKAESPIHTVEADPAAARFASWYELFPRSQTNDAKRHGTFADVIARLSDIAAMGFDVLYMPPIHPIGMTNRKGRNNAIRAEPGDPGSAYAIGSPEGGHTAIHPELGTLADFRALVRAAHAHGIEIALDFAIQCSPDHPWLKEHPGWFDWRPDGTIKYAENPPKRYEDIVNVDFYAKDAAPGLWLALRDVVLFWRSEGVRIFRVDNPHTKPFAFWRWLIADIKGRHPGTIFLSEAFTRPKVMYELAKLGFTQSYTYFTWRSTKAELTAYMTELTTPPVSDFFRPHFFVNTPDINPYFLQSSGRPGFLIRAALAATLSGLWGMYSGFELCEAAPLPGREEYKDSEKYEIKPRDWNAAGNIKAEIAQLNRLRRAEPALQTHLGLTFYNAFSDDILYFGKHRSTGKDRLLIAISLNPHAAAEADFEIPLWEWGLPDWGALLAQDLLRGGSFVWHGKIKHMRLTPDAPYAIWRVQPAEVR